MTGEKPYIPAESSESPSTLSYSSTKIVVDQVIDDRFRIVREIGYGGMSTVYEAKHLITGKQVAIKMMSGTVSSDSGYKQRFLREAKLLAQLNHPSIATVHAVGVFEDRLFLAMEMVPGKTLQEVLTDSAGPLSEEHACNYAMQICDALAHAHAAGVVHRDLKPGNILIDGDSIKLLDFGIAGWLNRDQSGRLTQTGEIFGSPQYMSPEQSQGMRLDGRSDIYSLGCILYEMLSGNKPFEGESLFELLAKQISSTPPPLKTVSPNLQNIVSKAMAKGLDSRYQTPTDLKNDLLKYRDGGKIHQPKGVTARRKPMKPHQAVIIVVVPVLVIAIALILNTVIHGLVEGARVADLQLPLMKAEEYGIDDDHDGRSFLFLGRELIHTTPEHVDSRFLMTSRLKAGEHDGQRDIFLRQAINRLRKQIHRTAQFEKLNIAERALMWHELAVWDAMLIRRPDDVVEEEERDLLYGEAIHTLMKAGELYDQIEPNWSSSYQMAMNKGFINQQYGMRKPSLNALDKAKDNYRKVIQLLSKRREDASQLTAEEQKVLDTYRQRLDNVHSELEKLKFPASTAHVLVNWHQDIDQFEKEMLSIEGAAPVTVPEHKQAVELFREYYSADTKIARKVESLEETKKALRNAIAAADMNKPSAILTEKSLIHLRLGICYANLCALSLDPERREEYYRQAQRNIDKSEELYERVHSGYSQSWEAMMHRGYVNHKYSELSNDLHGYELAHDYYTKALQIMSAKKAKSAHEEAVIDSLTERLKVVDHKSNKVQNAK